MKKLYKTKEGAYTESVSAVFVTEDGTEYNVNKEQEAIVHDIIGEELTNFPSRINICGEVFNYPSIYSGDLTLTYSSGDETELFFSIEPDGTYMFKELTFWDRCSEITLISNPKKTPSLNGKLITEFNDIELTEVEEYIETIFSVC